MYKASVLVVLAAVLTSCQLHRGASAGPNLAAAAPERVIDVSNGGSRKVEEVHRGFETLCRVNGKNFPPSYLVSDLGKSKVPALSVADLRQVRAISRYVHSPSLRFQTVDGQFLVYDASLGPCMLAAPGYWILNAPACNLYFMPADEWDGPSAVPGCYTPPRPWIPGDAGDRRLQWGKFPPSGISTPPPRRPSS